MAFKASASHWIPWRGRLDRSFPRKTKASVVTQEKFSLYTANLNLSVKVLDFVKSGGPIRTREC